MNRIICTHSINYHKFGVALYYIIQFIPILSIFGMYRYLYKCLGCWDAAMVPPAVHVFAFAASQLQNFVLGESC